LKDVEKLVRLFKALSVDTRVRIVALLRERALCVGALSARLKVTQGAVSQHLRVLREAGLVLPEKRGYYVHYRLNKKALYRWREAVERLLEGEEETACPPFLHEARRGSKRRSGMEKKWK